MKFNSENKTKYFLFLSLVITLVATTADYAQETDTKNKIKIVGIEVPTTTPDPNEKQERTSKKKVVPTPTPTPTQNRSNIKKSITLAVGQATRFRCPETPIQLILGNNSGFKVVEAVGENSNDFYLLPKQGGFTTNMFVEFSNSTTEIKLTIIDPKKNAYYDTEVTLDAPGTQNRSTQNTAVVNDLKQQLTNTQRLLADEKGLNLSLKAQLEDAKLKQPDMQQLLFNLYDRRNAWDAKTINLGNLRVNFIGNPVAVSAGNYVLMVEYVNRDKKKPTKIVEALPDGFEGAIKGNFDGELKPDETRRMLIELKVSKLAGAVARLKFQMDKTVEFYNLGQIQISPQS
jgi:hypothetical protein